MTPVSENIYSFHPAIANNHMYLHKTNFNLDKHQYLNPLSTFLLHTTASTVPNNIKHGRGVLRIGLSTTRNARPTRKADQQQTIVSGRQITRRKSTDNM